MGGELEAYNIKAILFLFVLGLLAATKTFFKRNKKMLDKIFLKHKLINS